ncbi:hypothetical protein OB919_17645 [Halobacteria archaeon AArc-curdl1]|uniref:ArsR family transcriptional regulator n=1 Tax=Natronosalvus hydrolyticus TaxID=2979988 RepID=A0AAP2ZDA8_9EURY|nr:hypothetical protein [Halobacteria archaeon AArc-curdl1]
MSLEARVTNCRRVVDRWDAVFEAITAEPRRQLIVSLLDAPADQVVSLPESAVNPDVPADAERLRQELFHVHLPKLEDQGFIHWDRDPLTASRGPRFEEVAVVFSALHANAVDIPDSLVIGCHRLESERQERAES